MSICHRGTRIYRDSLPGRARRLLSKHQSFFKSLRSVRKQQQETEVVELQAHPKMVLCKNHDVSPIFCSIMTNDMHTLSIHITIEHTHDSINLQNSFCAHQNTFYISPFLLFYSQGSVTHSTYLTTLHHLSSSLSLPSFPTPSSQFPNHPSQHRPNPQPETAYVIIISLTFGLSSSHRVANTVPRVHAPVAGKGAGNLGGYGSGQGG
ncbi:hypothetical protein BKA63DRAFT_51736 [Paraphoma chrysanthemicola]|nr:hypothetical protein BKA63DRAFT_51736 [Paraphoma chrysanthemicola]